MRSTKREVIDSIDKVKHIARNDQLYKNDVGGRARVITDEERVLQFKMFCLSYGLM